MRKNGDVWSFNTRDLMRASSCDHCTTLSVLHALEDPNVEATLQKYIAEQEAARAAGNDKTLPQRYGEEFEAQLTVELSEQLNKSELVRPAQDGDLAQTIELMSQRVPVIYQGGLEHKGEGTVFKGKPDFLVLEGWGLFFDSNGLGAKKIGKGEGRGYTVWDAKYSSHPKPEYALQVAIYIEALEQAGYLAKNEPHGLILGNRTLYPMSEYEIVPATRLARKELESAISFVEGADRANLLANLSYHCPGNKQCEICEYPQLCKDDREKTSDLLLVAGLGKSTRDKIINAGIKTLQELAASELTSVQDISAQTFRKLKAQAVLQAKSLQTGKPEHELLDDPMLQYLPLPSDGDVFFDMEGFPYFRDGGLEYLFGNWTEDMGFTPFWASTRGEEKQAFIDFMDWLMARMNANPTAHVFHYAPYERTALKRLVLRHGVKSLELAQLESEHRLVDLYPVVTKSLRISEPRYSIKNLEKFYRFERKAGVQKADDSIDEYCNWRDLVAAIDDPRLPESEKTDLRAKERRAFENLEVYNKEDVQSTHALYNWLLTFEGAATKFGEDLINTDQEEQTPTKAEIELRKLEELTNKFFAPLESMERGISEELDWKITAWETLAHSILFYRREDVMFWTNLNIRLQQEDGAFENDKEAILLEDVKEFSRENKQSGEGRDYLRISYLANYNPNSVWEPEAGDDVVTRFMLPGQFAARNFGKVITVKSGTVSFYRDVYNGEEIEYTPDAILKFQRFMATAKQTELNNLSEEITNIWASPTNTPPKGFPALDLLIRNKPSLSIERLGEPDRLNYLPALIEAADSMNKTALAVQGPPGSGKTYLASRLIKHLLETGKSVAVTANSHSAIENVLGACIEAGVNPNSIFKTRQTGDKKTYPWKSYAANETTGNNLAKAQRPLVVGGTSFSLCNTHIRPHQVDYLIIDEAAQFSLVDTLAVSGIAENIILFGDPQQLPQVVQAVHPGGVENSALGHFMGEHSILPEDLGFFVEITRRLHPAVNKAVSWLAYENKLQSHPDTDNNVLPGTAPGLHPVPVHHVGNSTFSLEEVEQVLELVRRHAQSLPPEEILIVAPYNSQVNAIRKALDENGFEDIKVGTVDKFQGREGMTVIVSLTASSAYDAPRGLSFLLDQNRLNVAVSRAKSVCYIVHSPNLLKATFSSLEDVKAVSRLAGLMNGTM